MPRLRLEAADGGDTFDLDGITGSGYGVSALWGAGGFGLPDVDSQWSEGAGDGAQFQGSRALARDVDLPLLISVQNRTAMRTTTARLARMLAAPMVLRFVEDDGTSWTLNVRRVGGG